MYFSKFLSWDISCFQDEVSLGKMETGKANKLVQTAIYMILASIYKGDTIIPLKLIDTYDLSISIDREDWKKCYYTTVCFSFCIDFRKMLLS